MQRASVIKSRRRARLDSRQKRWKDTVKSLSLDHAVLSKAKLHCFKDVLGAPEGELALLISSDQVPWCNSISCNTLQHSSCRKHVSNLLLQALNAPLTPNAENIFSTFRVTDVKYLFYSGEEI